MATSAISLQAQKITLGTYKMKDGGEYKGEMQSGKPHGKGRTVSKVNTSKANVRATVSILSLTARNTKANGFRTISTARVPIIFRTTIAM